MGTSLVWRWPVEPVDAPTVRGAVLDEGERPMHARAGVWREGSEDREMSSSRRFFMPVARCEPQQRGVFEMEETGTAQGGISNSSKESHGERSAERIGERVQIVATS